MEKIIIIGTILFTLVLATSSVAFRCGEYGNNLASSGMTKKEISSDCGRPLSIKRIRKFNAKKRCRMIEEWIYIVEEWGNKQVHAIRFDKHGVAVEEEWLGLQE